MNATESQSLLLKHLHSIAANVWGIGLLMRAGKIFMPTLLLGADWEKRAVENRLGRPL